MDSFRANLDYIHRQSYSRNAISSSSTPLEISAPVAAMVVYAAGKR
ncbi:hypothetical protein CCACVL1_24849 [Corchorus capsularis]|uniref:Uncharacterized protein n=1 Tax=Corchorus capsularis TaxID=210143 RepID=A0A1R3GMX4_COCAP|nr:hypothetical protein CCACVL1_24849 [Corchorus capsularis]